MPSQKKTDRFNVAMSKAMKEYWSDPEWAANQRRRISAGMRARFQQAPRKRNRFKCYGLQVYMDPEFYERFTTMARAQRMSFTELAEIYIEWGLEIEEQEENARVKTTA